MTTLKVVPDQQRLTDVVAEEVRAQLARARMTQTQLAEILGLPQSAVSNRLRGKVPFSVDDLEVVAGALGVHPATLLGGRGDRPEPPPATTARYSRESVTLGDFLTIGRSQPVQSVREAA